MINHEPQSIRNIALKRHGRTAIEQAAKVDLATFESAAHFGVRLELAHRNLEEGRNGIALVAPEGSFVGDADRVDGTHAGEEGALCSRESDRRGGEVSLLQSSERQRVGEWAPLL